MSLMIFFAHFKVPIHIYFMAMIYSTIVSVHVSIRALYCSKVSGNVCPVFSTSRF